MRVALIVVAALLAGCESTQFHMPDFVAYPSACPAGNYKCQRNLDAQTLRYIGDEEGAAKLMCVDMTLRQHMELCGEYY